MKASITVLLAKTLLLKINCLHVAVHSVMCDKNCLTKLVTPVATTKEEVSVDYLSIL